MRKILYILVACEESQAETIAFRKLGHVAYSCDLQPCRRGTPEEWHIIADVRPFLHGKTDFVVQNGDTAHVPRWDLIIAHPPCTYLCRVSSVRMKRNGEIQQDRFNKMQMARKFFFECLNADAPFVAVENPIPMALARLPKPSFYVDPSWFGVKFTKKTLYWVKNLPPIMPTIINTKVKCFVTCSRGKYRSRTFPQMAEQIAVQWSEYILNQINS